MKKPKSRLIFEDLDVPIGIVRLSVLKGLGIDVDELKQKPMIAVVNSHTELNPGHAHLKFLAERVKEGVHAAGGIPFEFNVPAPCDGVANGNEGMSFILPQRELIADMIETHVRSQLYDGLVLISSCDKINPGMIMAAARLDLPTIFLPGGPGAWQIRFTAGREKSVDHKDYHDIPRKLATFTCATCGACEIMGTANTFQCLAEAMGLTLPGSANVPAFHSEKLLWARRAGMRIVRMIEEGLTAKKILTRQALENALMVDLAICGSTNSALHLPAIAHELGFTLPLSAFNDYNRKIPTLCAISPSGPFGMVDLYAAGGVPAVMKRLAADLHLEALTVSGKTIGEVAAEASVLDAEVIPPRDRPHLAEGGTVALFGNLAPEGAVVKQSAVRPDMMKFTGRARVLDSEAEAIKSLKEKKVKEGEVLVIRYEGPRGGPGMPEILSVTTMLELMLMKNVALVTDGRFSGATSGPCIGHVSPETYDAGPIAALRDGDVIEIDIPGRRLEVKLSGREIEERLRGFKPIERPAPAGYLQRYRRHVSSAATGAILK
ncbi:MAG TPA: dihydroxy-acid dehydratase [bacterium]|nr:dihydroxy-acid dehydratase [bacterium]